MFMIEIDGIRVLYTGDYSLENDRHLVHAEVPEGGPPDVLIVESTFGTDNIPPREKRERDFTKAVESIVRRGGSCLIPVFALGRAQELLLILDEFWQQHPDLQVSTGVIFLKLSDPILLYVIISLIIYTFRVCPYSMRRNWQPNHCECIRLS